MSQFLFPADGASDEQVPVILFGGYLYFAQYKRVTATAAERFDMETLLPVREWPEDVRVLISCLPPQYGAAFAAPSAASMAPLVRDVAGLQPEPPRRRAPPGCDIGAAASSTLRVALAPQKKDARDARENSNDV